MDAEKAIINQCNERQCAERADASLINIVAIFMEAWNPVRGEQIQGHQD